MFQLFSGRSEVAVTVSIVTVMIVACSGEIHREAKGTNDSVAAEYKVSSREFGDGLELRSLYLCLDPECREVEIGASTQVVAWRQEEIPLDARRFVIDFLTSFEGRILAWVWNNHSSFLVNICPDGSLDYLTETPELSYQRVLDIECVFDAPFLVVTFSVEDTSSYEKPEEKYYQYRVLMGGGLEICQSVVRQGSSDAEAAMP